MARIFSKINKDIKYICFDTFHVKFYSILLFKYNNLNVGFYKKKTIFF